jgi:hypothetical protein
MFSKSFYVRMLLLWALIAAVRIGLTLGLTSGDLSPTAVSILTLAFLPVLLVIESLILLRAAKEFLSKPLAPRTGWDSMEKPPSKSALRSMRIVLALLLFALPSGLWSMRFDRETTLPILLGCIPNLLLVSLFTNALAVDKKRGQAEQVTAAPSSVS